LSPAGGVVTAPVGVGCHGRQDLGRSRSRRPVRQEPSPRATGQQSGPRAVPAGSQPNSGGAKSPPGPLPPGSGGSPSTRVYPGEKSFRRDCRLLEFECGEQRADPLRFRQQQGAIGLAGGLCVFHAKFLQLGPPGPPSTNLASTFNRSHVVVAEPRGDTSQAPPAGHYATEHAEPTNWKSRSLSATPPGVKSAGSDGGKRSDPAPRCRS